MTLGFNVPEYCTHPKHTTQKFWWYKLDVHYLHTRRQLPHPQSLLRGENMEAV